MTYQGDSLSWGYYLKGDPCKRCCLKSDLVFADITYKGAPVPVDITCEGDL